MGQSISAAAIAYHCQEYHQACPAEHLGVEESMKKSVDHVAQDVASLGLIMKRTVRSARSGVASVIAA